MTQSRELVPMQVHHTAAVSCPLSLGRKDPTLRPALARAKRIALRYSDSQPLKLQTAGFHYGWPADDMAAE